MLSYRHAFHAGNHADILKHLCLYLTLDYFNQKDKPYWYIDTHAGAGLYDLSATEAQKVGEYRDGIARLQAQAENTLCPPLAGLLRHLNQVLPQAQLYGGSPWVAQSLLRSSDKLRLFELHPADYQHLQHNMQAARLGRRGQIQQIDGFQGLISLLPPPTRRAVTLIDPPYEQKQDYNRVLLTLKQALQRFATGCYLVWYPCLSRPESQTLPTQLKQLAPLHYLQAELHVQAPRADGFGMHGSGMWVINPPYLLAEQLQQALPQLVTILGQDAQARFVLQHQAA